MNYLYTRCMYLLDMQATLFHSEWCTYLDKYWNLDNEWLQHVSRNVQGMSSFKAESIKIFLMRRNVDDDTDCLHSPWTEHVSQCRRFLNFRNALPLQLQYFYIFTIFNSIHSQPQTDTEVGMWFRLRRGKGKQWILFMCPRQSFNNHDSRTKPL